MGYESKFKSIMTPKQWDDIVNQDFITWDKGDFAVIAFGMVPKKRLDILMEIILDETAKKYTAEGAHYEGLDHALLKKSFKREFINSIEHDLSLAYYRNSYMVV